VKTAIYPGSFDPITKGHLDVLRTAAQIFDKVIIAIAENSQKNQFLPLDLRLKLIKESVAGLDNVEVDTFEGLTINYAKQKGAAVLIRGLRAVSDFEYEMQLSQTNSALSNEIKTVFLITKPEYNFISSSTVKEIVRNHGDISKFVPEPVFKYLTNDYKHVL
jgi:pantetheine-phosphate adenylyltransferase